MQRSNAAQSGLSASSWVSASANYAGGKGEPQNSASGGSGGGSANCNLPSQLEITAINIGQGDATLIASPTKLLLADAGESYWNSSNDANKIAEVIQNRYGANCTHIDYVVISHIHLDHIGYIQADEDSSGNLLDENGSSYQEGENILNLQFKAGFAHLVGSLGFTVGQTFMRDYMGC